MVEGNFTEKLSEKELEALIEKTVETTIKTLVNDNYLRKCPQIEEEL